jgi:hypothetical protein
MATIGYNIASPFGAKVSSSVSALKLAQTNVARCIDMANDLTVGGTVPANLEGSAQFGVAVGQGANFYNALQALAAAVFSSPANRTPIQATVDLDQGL